MGQGEPGRWQGRRSKESEENLKTSRRKLEVQTDHREVGLWVSMKGLCEMYKRQLDLHLQQGTRLLRVSKMFSHLF